MSKKNKTMKPLEKEQKWLRGTEILQRYHLHNGELLAMFKQGHLIPYDRVNDKKFETEEEIIKLAYPFLDNISEVKIMQPLLDLYFKKEEVDSYLYSLDIYDSKPSHYLHNLDDTDRMALLAVLLQDHGKSWEQMAKVLWPNEQYEHDNPVHERLKRALREGRKLTQS